MAEIPPEWRHERNHTERLERENDELARGILELQKKLTIAEQAHWLYREEVDRRLSAADKRMKYAEDRLQSAVNLGEMWHGRALKAKLCRTCEERRADTEDVIDILSGEMAGRVESPVEALQRIIASQEADLAIVPFPAGENPEARWGLTELGLRALLFEDIQRAGKSLLDFTEKFYDLAAVCSRCGRPYREHLEPEGPECDGFVIDCNAEAVPEEVKKLWAERKGIANPPLHFVCAACQEPHALSDRAPSTMPLCNECWRKDP